MVVRPDSTYEGLCAFAPKVFDVPFYTQLEAQPTSSREEEPEDSAVEALLDPESGIAPEHSPLLTLLAAVVEAIVEANNARNAAIAAAPGALPPRLTVFHGLRAPPISIEAYLVRTAKYARCSPVCFVFALHHLLRLARRDPALAPCSLNVHRLLLTAVLLGAKFFDDRYFNNAFYAKVGGVSTAELNRLEVEMLRLLDFQLNVSHEAVKELVRDAESGLLLMRHGFIASPPPEAAIEYGSGGLGAIGGLHGALHQAGGAPGGSVTAALAADPGRSCAGALASVAAALVQQHGAAPSPASAVSGSSWAAYAGRKRRTLAPEDCGTSDCRRMQRHSLDAVQATPMAA